MLGFKPGGPTLRELIRQGLSSVKDGYDQLAPKFDRTPFLSNSGVLDEVTRCLMARREYATAIDFCTGTGAGITALLPAVQYRIMGIDWSKPMLDEASRKLEAINPDGPCVTLVAEDIFAIEYRQKFDLATCFGAFGHFDRRKRREFIRLAHSALKPGGDFVMDTLNLPVWSPKLWFGAVGFDAVMYVRNLFIRPPFIMYYLPWLLPAVLPLFSGRDWSSVTLKPVAIDGRPGPFCLLIATKR